jgi:hypothetical protein
MVCLLLSSRTNQISCFAEVHRWRVFGVLNSLLANLLAVPLVLMHAVVLHVYWNRISTCEVLPAD